MLSLARHARRVFRGARRINSSITSAHECLLAHRSFSASSLTSQLPTTSTFPKNYSARPAYKENIDPLLQRLDEDVRRFGRLSRQDVDKLIEGIRTQSDVTSSQALLIIRCCGDLVSEEVPTERTKLAEKLWKTFEKRNVPMDISHYNALLRVYVENKHDFSTNQFMKNLEEKGIEPNRVTYQRLMWQRCQKGDVEGASHILETMRAKNLPLNDAVLDALVLGNVRQGNMEGVNSVLKAMSAAGLNPTSNTYKIIMEGYARKGDIESVKRTLEETAKQEIFLSDKELMDVIEEFATSGHSEHVTFILSQMQRSPGYNQEAINLIYQLLNKGQHNVAIQIFETMNKSAYLSDNNTPSYQGAFFIKHLFKCNTPKDLLLSVCQELQEKGLAPKGIEIAAHYAMVHGNFNLAVSFFHHMKKIGLPIRQHYFWPIFVSQSSNDTVEILRSMVDDFELNLTVETVRDYVLPQLKNKDPVKVVELLRDSGVSSLSILRAMLQTLLTENRILEASKVVSVYGSKSNLKNISSNLLRAFTVNPDVDALLNILNVTCSEEISIKSTQNDDSENIVKEIKLEQRVLLSNFLIALMENNSSEIQSKIQIILEGYLSNKLGISNESVEIIKKRFPDVYEKCSELLTKLIDNELQPDGFDNISLPPIRRSPQQLENLINTLESKGENTNRLQKQLLLAHTKSQNVEKVEKMLENFELNQFVVTGGVLASIFDMYTQVGSLEKAKAIKEKLLSTQPDFIIDEVKILRYSLLLLNENEIGNGIKVLEEIPHKNAADIDDNHYLSKSLCWNILNTLSEKCDPDKLKVIFEMLLEKNVIKPSNNILEPLIKCHLSRNNLKDALDAFEHCCSQYKCSPLKSELIRQLIMQEDANGLQKLTDLSTTIYGEINSLYDLAFGFVECGRMKQAKRILETPGMRIRNKRLNDISKYYVKSGKIEFLEKLIDITKNMSHIDRMDMFEQLLNYHIKEDNTDKAVSLWTTLQEESVPPSDEFLIVLANYLKSKNIAVPFIVPDINKVTKKNEVVENRDNKKNLLTKSINNQNTEINFTEFKECVKNGNYERAEVLLTNLLKSDNISNQFLKYAITIFSVEGKVDILNNLKTLLSESQMKIASFDNKTCFAYTKVGKADIYLDQLDEKISNATEENITLLDNCFPKGGILGILEDKIHYEKAKNIILKYASKGAYGPINSLWSFHLCKGNTEEARKLWDKYLTNSKVIFFQRIIETARSNQDANMLSVLLELMTTKPDTSGNTLALIYTHQLDILSNLDRFDEASKTIDAALNNGVSLDMFDKAKLLKLKMNIESTGGSFKHNLDAM